MFGLREEEPTECEDTDDMAKRSQTNHRYAEAGQVQRQKQEGDNKTQEDCDNPQLLNVLSANLKSEFLQQVV